MIPDDVKALAETTLAHRVIVNPAARMRGIESRSLIGDLLRSVPVPGAQPLLRAADGSRGRQPVRP